MNRLKTIAGLLAVIAGLAVVAIVAIIAMTLINSDNPSVVSIATGAFTVTGTVVGAYFGVKAGNDNTEKALNSTQNAIEGLRDEASKATAFAAHMDGAQARSAVDTYVSLRAAQNSAEPSSSS
jgi:hypothetical protein